MDFNPIGEKIIPKLIQPSRDRVIAYPDLYASLSKCKSGIKNNDEWDKTKKLGNPYELIHISNRSNYNSIAKHSPVSRSYFKLWEILNDYAGILPDRPAITASLAEGPGGFIEAIRDFRRNDSNRHDELYGITLESTNKYVPGWNIEGAGIQLSYGNIYDQADIMKFIAKIPEGVDLLTADGGFDYSVDFNNQEQQSYRIIFSELTAGLIMQKLGGTMVCKVFDIFTEFTVKMLYLLYCLYDRIYIVKPKTSRPANSEKYILAKGFKGIDAALLQSMKDILFNWNDDIVNLTGIEVPKEFAKRLEEYNREYVKNQIYYLNSIIDLVANKPTKMMYKNIIRKQAENAVDWCNKYNMIINTDSKYLKY